MGAGATGARQAGRRSTQKLVPAGRASGRDAERPVAGAGLARGRYRATRLSAGSIRLEPRSVGQLLDTACELFAARFAPLFAVGFCLWVPATVMLRMMDRESPVAASMQLLLHGLVGALCSGFACVLVAARIEGREISALDAFLAVTVRVPGLLFLSFLLGVSGVLVFLCCIGVVPSWLLAVAPAVYVIERCNVLRAIGRSVTLVASGGGFVRWAGYSMLGGLMTAPFTQLHQALDIPEVHERLRGALSLSGAALDLVISAVSAPFLAVGTAFLAVVQAVYYFDQRVRREGYDLERRVDALEQDEAARPQEQGA